ncbi:MAG: ABC transporter permease subunit [Gemmatimonadetes bacterium]|nr:ABC transporter permease subunit [Gemmatimonadota bacterium]
MYGLFAVLMALAAPLTAWNPLVVSPPSMLSGTGDKPPGAPSERIQSVGDPVVVASKPFAESYVLAEAFAQLLEENGVAVDRRFGLASTEVIFQAVRTGEVDVYPEYTGTALTAVLGEEATGTPPQVFVRVSRAFEERWGVRWLPPLGFENTYAVAMRRTHADSLGISTLSELAQAATDMRGGFSPDFIGRPDGLPGLGEAYGLEFLAARSLLQAVKYEALVRGEVDVIDGYSTDGAIPRFDLTILADDRGFFPPYDAAPVVSRRVAEGRPEVVSTLSLLGGRVDVELMQAMNRRAEVDGAPVQAVAAELLAAVGLSSPQGAPPPDADTQEGTGAASQDSEPPLMAYLWSQRSDTLRQTRRHLALVVASLLAAILLAVPLALLLEGVPRWAEGAIRGVGVLQTIPSIALLAFMIPLFGIGVLPAIVALFLYSLLPILRNTYTGITEADSRAVAAASALGMTRGQILREIRLPLAVPTIMAGVRTAAVINVGTATLAAFIGAGGLGDPIVSGLALSDARMILSGAIPAAALAVLVDLVLAQVETAARPRGV